MGRQLAILTETEVDANRERYKSLVGKEVSIISNGKRVVGNVREFSEDNYNFYLMVDHEPVSWSGLDFTTTEAWARKIDDWGSLNNLKVI